MKEIPQHFRYVIAIATFVNGLATYLFEKIIVFYATGWWKNRTTCRRTKPEPLFSMD